MMVHRNVTLPIIWIISFVDAIFFMQPLKITLFVHLSFRSSVSSHCSPVRHQSLIYGMDGHTFRLMELSKGFALWKEKRHYWTCKWHSCPKSSSCIWSSKKSYISVNFRAFLTSLLTFVTIHRCARNLKLCSISISHIFPDWLTH